ncbi:Protein transport protein Sec61 subunit beta [Acorus gramineus]|uniref:Protein transport protein Sec61 subunit beta n=2 Tax=Acorus TaxID=4464 RepID=A0AAV9CP07_ACOCL|nr:Protein transport protein Sec61 subunit beta [Acorus gramineus]KAK1290409.1 Protein transport protein Sec61 subunit beta [Acorus calamus]KAK1315350.1 Protein transport protein Sec61 subunit beta [Acorus calamus]
MVANGEAPPRGSAAAVAGLRRRRAGGAGAASAAGGGSGANSMLQFYTDDATGLKISPNTVLAMSVGFIAVVAILHAIGKLYLVSR